MRLPSPYDRLGDVLRSILSEPLFDGCRLCLLTEAFRAKREGCSDESIGSFVRRRFSAAAADNIVSAGIHGIYAGDIDHLSLKALLPAFFALEILYGSISKTCMDFVLRRRRLVSMQTLKLENELGSSFWESVKQDPTFRRIREASVYTFKGGLGHLVAKLVESLRSDPNIKIRTSSSVGSLKLVNLGQRDAFPQKTSRVWRPEHVTLAPILLRHYRYSYNITPARKASAMLRSRISPT